MARPLHLRTHYGFGCTIFTGRNFTKMHQCWGSCTKVFSHCCILGIGYMRTWSIVQSTFSNGRKFFFNWVIYIYDWSAQRAQQRIPWFFFRLRIAASFVCLVIILVIWSIFKHVRLSYQLPNWWAPWNLSCLEFKFDDTRLSYWHKE